MSTEIRENCPPPKRLHWIRWPLTLATVVAVAYLVHAILTGDQGNGNESLQRAFGLLILSGIGTALSWTVGRSDSPQAPGASGA